MTLTQILYFNTLAETENMRKAAEQLFISQPSLSISIRKLEEELGVFLLERTNRHIVLTDAGREFLTHCKQILRDVDAAEQHMKRISSEQETRISLGCVEPLLHDYLPRQMRHFLAKPENTSVEFEIRSGTTPQLIQRLKDGFFDFLLCTEETDPELEQIQLLTTPLVLIRHPEQIRNHDSDLKIPGQSVEVRGKATIHRLSPYTWDEIAVVPMLGYQAETSMNKLLSQMWLEQGIYPAYRYRMPDESSIASLVANGFGFAVIPWTEDLTNYSIDICPLPSGNYVRTLCITYLKGHQVPGASGRFIEYIH